MSLYILDTDHVTLLQQAHPLLVRHVATVEPAALAVTIITAEEQLRGWLAVIRQCTATPRVVWAYARLRAAVDYFKSIRLLDFDQAAYARFDELRLQKIRIGTQDLRIAAIVLAADGILITRNQRDFSQIPGLKSQDWTLP
jgi:tRNA(fMet)-specific endonuclease VapC